MSSASFPSFTSPGLLDRRSPMFTASGKEMGKSGQIRGRVSPSDDRTFAEHVTTFLRGMHPNKTAQCASADTGIPATTIRKWLEQGCAPSGRHTALLSRRYPGFLAAVFPDAQDEWIAEIARNDALEALERQAATIHQQMSDILRGRL